MTKVEWVTQVELCVRLGVSKVWVQQLTSRGIFKRNADKKYPWPESERVYREFQKETHPISRKKQPSTGTGDADLDAEKTLKMRAEREKAEIELALMKRESVPIAEARLIIKNIFATLNSALKSAPARHSSELAKVAGVKKARAQLILAAIIEDIRSEIRGLSKEEMIAGGEEGDGYG